MAMQSLEGINLQPNSRYCATLLLAPEVHAGLSYLRVYAGAAPLTFPHTHIFTLDELPEDSSEDCSEDPLDCCPADEEFPLNDPTEELAGGGGGGFDVGQEPSGLRGPVVQGGRQSLLLPLKERHSSPLVQQSFDVVQTSTSRTAQALELEDAAELAWLVAALDCADELTSELD